MNRILPLIASISFLPFTGCFESSETIKGSLKAPTAKTVAGVKLEPKKFFNGKLEALVPEDVEEFSIISVDSSIKGLEPLKEMNLEKMYQEQKARLQEERTNLQKSMMDKRNYVFTNLSKNQYENLSFSEVKDAIIISIASTPSNESLNEMINRLINQNKALRKKDSPEEEQIFAGPETFNGKKWWYQELKTGNKHSFICATKIDSDILVFFITISDDSKMEKPVRAIIDSLYVSTNE